jgi:Rrf2 family protein
MPISTKGEYAARAMLHLALMYENGALSSASEIAQAQKIPKKYLEQILLLFKHAGLVQSKPGLHGGYLLGRAPIEITMAQIIRAVDGPLAPTRCVSKMAYTRCTCTDESTCALRTVWQEARDTFVGVLEGITLAEVAKRARRMQGIASSDYVI